MTPCIAWDGPKQGMELYSRPAFRQRPCMVKIRQFRNLVELTTFIDLKLVATLPTFITLESTSNLKLLQLGNFKSKKNIKILINKTKNTIFF